MIDLGLNKPAPSTRVAVAMSGGVDSSTAAAMLVAAGFDVVGLTLRLHEPVAATDDPDAGCADPAIDDARRVAETLGIPHHVLDRREHFRRRIMEPFADSYLGGETPVPCAVCNHEMKFGELLAPALEFGADVLVTGHYVRWRAGARGPELHRAADESRDQSYFLFAITPAQLGRARFPLGGLRKEDTRSLAATFRLPVAAKRASQDICFVPNGRYGDVVARLRPEADTPGDIVDLDGRVIGRHAGISGFTVGQRRGIGVTAPEPQYVIRLEPMQRRVIVGPAAALGCQSFSVRNINWLDDDPLPATGRRVSVKVRSTRPPAAATVFATTDAVAEVEMTNPESAVAPGQACVFYDGDRLLGGGWICRPPRAA